MKNILIQLSAIFAVLTTAYAEPPRPVIGIVGPLSGQLAFMGEGIRKGMMSSKELTSSYSLIFEDSKGSGTDAVSAFRKLVDVQHPALVLVAGAGAEQISHIVTSVGPPVVFTIASASGLADAGKGAFRYFTNADVDAPVLAVHAFKTRGFRKMAIVNLQDRFCIDYARVFAGQFEKEGGKIVAQETFNHGDNDIRAQLLRIKNASPDALYLVGLDFQIIGLAAQVRQLGLKQPLLAIGTIATREAIDKAGGLFEGVEVTAFCTDGPDPEFVKTFKAANNGAAPDFFAELGADLAEIVLKAKGKDAKSFADGLRSPGSMDLNAGKVTADPSGEMIIPACVKKITGGRMFNLSTGKYSDY